MTSIEGSTFCDEDNVVTMLRCRATNIGALYAELQSLFLIGFSAEDFLQPLNGLCMVQQLWVLGIMVVTIAKLTNCN